MSIDSTWEFAGAVPDDHTFKIGDLDVWKHEWKDTKERAHVKDPLYHQDFTFYVYEIGSGDKIMAFAAGEFSNCIWGFYTRKQQASP